MKRLIIYCDGTWNSADQKANGVPTPTNVVRQAYRIAKADGSIPQVTCYVQGVGTGNWLDKISGGATGAGLEENIHDAYRFLIANYELGDEIYLFGFSRGAFTARSVGGMIRKCGIIRRDSVKNYADAVALYRGAEHPDDEGPRKFRLEHSLSPVDPIKIKFIGVWDTVGALGIPLSGFRSANQKQYQFHDTELSGSVEYAYHALAIDEHRAPFEPTLWLWKGAAKPGQTVEQVWFCGAHSDVGGGYPERALSDIPLIWMRDKARAAGLAIDLAADSAYPMAPDPLGQIHESLTWTYRLTSGSLDRPIGLSKLPGKPEEPPSVPDPTQSLHPSVLERWDRDSGYRPKQVREFLKRIGDSRG